MIKFPNCKINLGLNIVAKREDGYHNLETVFYPIPLEDTLEIMTADKEEKESKRGKAKLTLFGNAIKGKDEDNLVMKAYKLLDRLYQLPPVDIFLDKQIPSGAGLGGGSSDAAFTLMLLNELHGLGLDCSELERHASTLGADCAFFIRNRPTFAEGIGNIFSDVSLNLSGYGIVIVKPDIFVSTREAFTGITPHKPKSSSKDIINNMPIEKWRELLTNDFEENIFRLHPAIGNIKEKLYNMGAVYASMSGSGSSVYGLFASGTIMPEQSDFPENLFFYRHTL